MDMAPARDPETIGELWQYIVGQFSVLSDRMDSNDKTYMAAISRLVDSVKIQDGRLDQIEDGILRRTHIPEQVKELQEDVQGLKDNQRSVIAGGSILLFLTTILWPTIRGWLHLGGP